VERVEDVPTSPSGLSPSVALTDAGGAPSPEHRNFELANVVGIALCALWAAIVVPFGWYWIFPDAKGTFSFGQLLLALLPGPAFYAIGTALGKKLGVWAMVIGGIIAAILVTLFFFPSLFRPAQVPLAEFRRAQAPSAESRPAQGPWAEFTSDSGGFSVLMPGTPEESEQTRPVQLFSLTMHMFRAEIAGGPEECFVSYSDYPEPMMGMNPKELLDDSCQGMEASGRGKLIGVRPISLTGYPGREVMCERYQQGGTWFVRSRLYLVDRRLYQLACASRQQERVSSREIDAFLASFKLTRKSANTGKLNHRLNHQRVGEGRVAQGTALRGLPHPGGGTGARGGKRHHGD
jgi:hypothetical protein